MSVGNPLQIKAFGEFLRARQKADRADAALIARFAESNRRCAGNLPLLARLIHPA